MDKSQKERQNDRNVRCFSTFRVFVIESYLMIEVLLFTKIVLLLINYKSVSNKNG